MNKKVNIVYDNLVYKFQKSGGVSRYWYEITRRVSEKKNTNITYVSNKKSFYEIKNIKKNIIEEQIHHKILKYIPFTIKLKKNSIFHSSFYRISLQKNIINVTTVHDFTYEKYRRGLSKFIHSTIKNFAIKNSKGIICISESTKKDLLKYLPNVDENKIKVIYNGANKDFYKLKDLNLPAKFLNLLGQKIILFVGNRKHYKNFNLAIDVVSQLPTFKFCIVGNDELEKEEINSLNMKLKNRYTFYRNISDQDLNIMYNISFCLLYPSSYEGFGIPIVEANRSGCPVVANNKSSIPELVGSTRLLTDSEDVSSFISKIKLLEDEAIRQEEINLGLKNAQKFDWDITAKNVLEFYIELLKNK